MTMIRRTQVLATIQLDIAKIQKHMSLYEVGSRTFNELDEVLVKFLNLFATANVGIPCDIQYRPVMRRISKPARGHYV